MWNANSIKIGLICVLGFTACGDETKEDPAAGATQPAIDGSRKKGVDSNLIGTFVSDSRRPGDLTQLVLKTNGTFHSATLVACFAPPCHPVQEDGIYRISARGSLRYITLVNLEGTVMDRYEY